MAAPVAVCFCCRTVAAQLGLPLVSLVALCEYRVGDGTHRHLRGYKDARSWAGRDGYRGRLVTGLDVILATAIPALADSSGGQLVVTTVPSSHRPGPAPVEALVDGVAVLRSLHLPLLVRGPAHLGHLQAHRRAFRTAPGVGRAGLEGLDVLVFDDTTTTGASVQSAAATLRLAGARVIGALVVGRALAPVRPGPGDPVVGVGDPVADAGALVGMV